MANNLIENDSDQLDLVAPYQCNAGKGALVGSIFGVAQTTVAAGATAPFKLDGVHALDKVSAQAWSQGDLVYWDNAVKLCTTVPSGNTRIGFAASPAANPSSTGAVALNGTGPFLELFTTADITLYVDPLGSDSNPGTSPGASACLTIQGALNKIPKRIRHLVTINVAAGNYAGFEVAGFIIEQTPTANQVGINLVGTRENATGLASGTATGTLTSVTPGSSSTAAFTVWTDSGQNWASDALKGKFIEILSGTGIGTIMPITGNTATSVTVPLTVGIAAAGATYAIRDCTSAITTPISTGVGPPTAGASVSATTLVGVNINGVTCPYSVTCVRMEFFKMALSGVATSSVGMVVQGCNGALQIANWQFIQPTLLTHIQLNGPGALFGVSQVVFDAVGASATYISSVGGSFVGSTGALATLNLANLLMKPASVGVSAVNLAWANSLIETASGLDMPAIGKAIINGLRFVTPTLTTSAIRAKVTLNNYGGAYLACPGGRAIFVQNKTTAVDLEGTHYCDFWGSVLGDTNTNAFVLAKGARVRISSTTAIAATNEVTLDGTVSTFATMRAANPKVLSSAYGSYAHEA